MLTPSTPVSTSSMIRTPCPSRSAPHHCRACQIEGSPNASPAWIVKCALLALQVLERVEVPGGREAGLRPGDVEADHPVVAVRHGELRDLHRTGRVPHGGEQLAAHDRRSAPLRLLLPVGEALPHGLDDRVQAEPASRCCSGA
jgi:hypothetical protein